MIIVYLIFWTSLAALVYSYLIYPLLLNILSSFKHPDKTVFSFENLPSISILIAAHNEELVIGKKLESIFESHYPPEKLEIFVGSDASSDGTDDIVNSLSKKYKNIHRIPFFVRTGKINIINKLVELSTHSILIITDANIIFDRDTLSELVKHFADERVALADTHVMPKGHDRAGVLPGESFYLKQEVNTKYREGVLWGTMMGPFGGCYAVRKEYYSPVPENFLVDDFYINMKVLEKGGLAISEIKAMVYEDVSHELKVEFRRKVRIATGSFQNLFHFLYLLFRPNAVSFCFVSHKVIRWVGPLLLLFIFCSSFIIASQNSIFVWYLGVEIVLLCVVPVDYVFNKIGINIRPLRILRYFFFTNLAILIGMFKAIRGVSSSAWQPTQRK